MTSRTIYEVNGITSEDTAISSRYVRNIDFEIDYLEITVKTGFDIVNGDILLFKSGTGYDIFEGRAEGITPTSEGNKTLKIYSYERDLDLDIKEITYTSQAFNTIVDSLITTNSTMTFVNSTTQNPTIEEFTSKNKTSWQIIKDLMERLINVTYYVNFSTKVFTIFEMSSNTISQTLINYSNCVIFNEWELDSTNQVTNLTLIGNKQTKKDEVDLFNGDGVTASFVLTEIPTTLVVTVGGVAQTLQTENTGAGDYTYSKDTKTITFQAGSIPASGTNNISCTYDFDLNLKVNMIADPTVISTYGTKKIKMTKSFLNNYDDMNDFANNYLDIFSSPLIRNSVGITQTLNPNSYIPGYGVTVVDNFHSIYGNTINGVYTINELVREMPSGRMVISVGDRRINFINYLTQLESTVKQLDEKDDNSSIGLETQFLKNPVAMKFDLDITSIEKRTFDSDTFYLEEDGAGTRNQMLNSGLGPVMRNIADGNGYTSSTITGTIPTNGVVTSTFMTSAMNDFLTELDTLITHVATGDDDTAFVSSDTTLGNELYREAKFSSSISGNTYSVDLRLDTTENNGNDMKEIGTFDAGAAGNMYTRNIVTTIAKDNTKETFHRTKVIVSTTNEDLN